VQRLKKLFDEQQEQVDKIKKSLKYWEDNIFEVQKKQSVLKVDSSTNTNIFEVLENEYLDPQDIDEDSNLNDYLQELQEKLFLQSLHQVNKKPDDILAEAIQETEEIITKAVAHQESIQKDFEKAQKEAKYWNEKAKIALQSNDDDLALQSVVNKKIQNKIAVTIQIQL
jgi:phage shock protein A